MIGQNASLDLQEIYRDLLDREKRESSEDLNISPPEICTNSSQMRNDSAFNASGEDLSLLDLFIIIITIYYY